MNLRSEFITWVTGFQIRLSYKNRPYLNTWIKKIQNNQLWWHMSVIPVLFEDCQYRANLGYTKKTKIKTNPAPSFQFLGLNSRHGSTTIGVQGYYRRHQFCFCFADTWALGGNDIEPVIKEPIVGQRIGGGGRVCEKRSFCYCLFLSGNGLCRSLAWSTTDCPVWPWADPPATASLRQWLHRWTTRPDLSKEETLGEGPFPGQEQLGNKDMDGFLVAV